MIKNYNNTWGCLSEKQYVPNYNNTFKSSNEDLKVLEIGPGKGLLLPKIKQIYGENNVYGMQPLNAEYSNENKTLKSMFINGNFIEDSLENYVKSEYIQFDIIFIYKWNISIQSKIEFIEALNKIVKLNGIIYITCVEKERLYLTKKYEYMYILNDIQKYFNYTYPKEESIPNEPYLNYNYGSIKLKKLTLVYG